MVWGHNLQHMAPFEALTSGFCMVFQPATLIFLTLDPIFGAPGQGLGPRRPRGPFRAQKGGPENMILWRDWSPTRFTGICCEGNGFYGTQEPFGCARFPPNTSRQGFYRDFPQTRKFQGFGPLGGLPIVPLWAIGLLQGSVAWPQALCIITTASTHVFITIALERWLHSGWL